MGAGECGYEVWARPAPTPLIRRLGRMHEVEAQPPLLGSTCHQVQPGIWLSGVIVAVVTLRLVSKYLGVILDGMYVFILLCLFDYGHSE